MCLVRVVDKFSFEYSKINGLNLKISFLAPGLKICKPFMSFKRFLYSDFAGSITKNGIFCSFVFFNIPLMVLDFPLPVAPETKTCELIASKLSLNLCEVSFFLLDIFPISIQLYLSSSLLCVRPKPDILLTLTPSMSFFGSADKMASYLVFTLLLNPA